MFSLSSDFSGISNMIRSNSSDSFFFSHTLRFTFAQKHVNQRIHADVYYWLNVTVLWPLSIEESWQRKPCPKLCKPRREIKIDQFKTDAVLLWKFCFLFRLTIQTPTVIHVTSFIKWMTRIINPFLSMWVVSHRLFKGWLTTFCQYESCHIVYYKGWHVSSTLFVAISTNISMGPYL